MAGPYVGQENPTELQGEQLYNYIKGMHATIEAQLQNCFDEFTNFMAIPKVRKFKLIHCNFNELDETGLDKPIVVDRDRSLIRRRTILDGSYRGYVFVSARLSPTGQWEDAEQPLAKKLILIRISDRSLWRTNQYNKPNLWESFDVEWWDVPAREIQPLLTIQGEKGRIHEDGHLFFLLPSHQMQGDQELINDATLRAKIIQINNTLTNCWETLRGLLVYCEQFNLEELQMQQECLDLINQLLQDTDPANVGIYGHAMKTSILFLLYFREHEANNIISLFQTPKNKRNVRFA